jgi:drug/metabolite transporter (DMT)-like permease
VKESLYGYILTLVSTVIYALYEVVYKKVLQSRPHMDSVRWAMLFCGLIGLGNLLTVWLPLPFLHWCGWEAFHAPSAEQWPMLAGIIALEGTFNGALLVGIQLVTPFFMTVGNVLTLPGSVAADFWLHAECPPFMQISGLVLIGAGFRHTPASC